MTSLNPVFTVGDQICEPLMKHLGLSARAAMARAEALLAEVGMPEPKRRLSAYPHQLSGGQQQRVMIAMALACKPDASDRRRTHHRARRDHPAPDHGAARGVEVAPPDEHAVHQPRPRRGRRDRGPRGRDAPRHGARAGRRGRHLRDPARCLHQGLAGLPADAGSARVAPDGDRRPHRGPRRRHPLQGQGPERARDHRGQRADQELPGCTAACSAARSSRP